LLKSGRWRKAQQAIPGNVAALQAQAEHVAINFPECRYDVSN
jgi:hypothetical protein